MAQFYFFKTIIFANFVVDQLFGFVCFFGKGLYLDFLCLGGIKGYFACSYSGWQCPRGFVVEGIVERRIKKNIFIFT